MRHLRACCRPARVVGLFVLLLLFGAASLAGAQLPDPGAPGPLAVLRDEYTFGDAAFVPTDFATLPAPPAVVEITGSVHYPAAMTQGGGPYPLLLFMHGRHSTAYDPRTGEAFLQWPPATGRLSIPSYKGYDYVAQTLASYGYVVVSVSANGINARDNGAPDRGARARAELIQAHLALWQGFSTTGGAPFGSRFVGKINLQNIGTMGHSRGGEGVVRHYLYNQDQGSPFGVRAVFPIAPVDYNRPIINGVPLFLILPYADGDVRDQQGIHFFDDARYNRPGDPAPKYFATILGGNHNFYNTFWTPSYFAPGGADDWMGSDLRRIDPFASTSVPGNQRLTPEQQQGTALAYMGAFFRAYIGGEQMFVPYLKGDVPPPPSAQTSNLFLTYQAPDMPALRRDVNRFLSPADLATNTLNGSVTRGGALAAYELVGGQQTFYALPGQPAARQPSNTPALYFPQTPGLSQLHVAWNGLNAFVANDLPAGARDVSGYYALQFRTSVDFTDYRNRYPQSDFSVVLTDGAGRSAATPVSRWSNALLFPPGRYESVPKVILNMVRIPLAAFSGSGGVNLSDVRSIRFVFDRRPSGGLLLTDLAFADSASGGALGLASPRLPSPPLFASFGVSRGDTVLDDWVFSRPLATPVSLSGRGQ